MTIGHILRNVADQSAKAPFEMMDCIIRRASEMNLNAGRTPKITTKNTRTGVDSEVSDTETELGSTRTEVTRYSEASDVCYTDDENNSIRYTYEYPPSACSVVQIGQPPLPGCSRTDLESQDATAGADSSGAQTLAELKREITQEKAKKRPSKLPIPSTRNPNRAVSRLCERNISRVWTGHGPLCPDP